MNCGVELEKKGILQKYNVKVLGTPVHSIEDTGDRERFRQAMLKANVPPVKQQISHNSQQALEWLTKSVTQSSFVSPTLWAAKAQA